MSVYRGTNATELKTCLESIGAQSVVPQEIVIVFDGPVSKSVEAYVARQSELDNINLIRKPTNEGLGSALRDGLRRCRYDIVARMDTDDICMNGRFEKQCDYLGENEQISLVGGQLAEKYTIGGNEITVERRLPESPHEITAVAKHRNPLNHPTIMFRKKDVIVSGGYMPFPLLEDYHLFARMLVKGCLLANLPQVFVQARADDQYFERRGGLAYFRQEILLTKVFRDIGFHTWPDSIRFLLIRAPVRLLPKSLRRRLYITVLRSM
jgi:glycosyltransferase involved in cell wall biosynthesis